MWALFIAQAPVQIEKGPEALAEERPADPVW
jgi:hypothetical protein